MIALPTPDPGLLPREEQGSLLPERLIDFANEAFVFSHLSRSRTAPKAEDGLRRFPAPTRAYFADVAPPPLSHLHLRNTRVVPSREHILALLPKGGVCAEIDTRTGAFGHQILSIVQPVKLHLCDRNFDSFDDTLFAEAIEQGIVELHEGERGGAFVRAA